MNDNMQKNLKSGLPYLLIPILLIVGILIMSGQNKQETKQYSEIVTLFRTNQVKEFDLDLSSGNLRYKLFSDEKDKINTYTVPNVAYFIDDISEYVKSYNEQNPTKPIKYNYRNFPIYPEF